MKIRSVSWCLAILLAIGVLGSAEGAGNLTQVGTWKSLGSPAHDLVVKGNFAYVATDVGLKIVDLTNPAAPVLRGSVNNLGLRGLGIAVVGDLVYVANQSRDLQILNVANPDAPVLVKTFTLPGNTWDVALKDDRPSGGPLIAYVASFSGEVYVVDVTIATAPRQVKVLGMLAWGSKAGDAANLLKLRNHQTSGNGKVTGLDVAGNALVIVEWAYGRLYYYNVTDAENPIFSGTHYAPFLFRVSVDPVTMTAYSLSAFGGTSGVYTVPLSILGPTFSTRHETCGACGYFQSPATDFGGINVSTSGRYAMYIAGKAAGGEVQVIDVTDVPDMDDVGSVLTGAHQSKLAQTMGVAQYGNDYVIAAGGVLGIGVFRFPGLAP